MSLGIFRHIFKNRNITCNKSDSSRKWCDLRPWNLSLYPIQPLQASLNRKNQTWLKAVESRPEVTGAFGIIQIHFYTAALDSARPKYLGMVSGSTKVRSSSTPFEVILALIFSGVLSSGIY
jgi:hypothetical protein